MRGQRRNKSNLQDLLDRKEDSYFEVVKINGGIGYGVFCRKTFEKGDFLLEYKGEQISKKEAFQRTKLYDKESRGSFVFDDVKDAYGKDICIDATFEKSYGKLVNDSPESLSNSRIKRIIIGKCVHLCIFAKELIPEGTELRYDYGEEVEAMPWRKITSCLYPFHSQDLKYPDDVYEIKAITTVCPPRSIYKTYSNIPVFDSPRKTDEYVHKEILPSSLLSLTSVLIKHNTEGEQSSSNDESMVPEKRGEKSSSIVSSNNPGIFKGNKEEQQSSPSKWLVDFVISSAKSEEEKPSLSSTPSIFPMLSKENREGEQSVSPTPSIVSMVSEDNREGEQSVSPTSSVVSMVSKDNRKGEQSVSPTPSVVPMVSEDNREGEQSVSPTPSIVPMVCKDNREGEQSVSPTPSIVPLVSKDNREGEQSVSPTHSVPIVSEDNREGEQSVSPTPSIVPVVSKDNREGEQSVSPTPSIVQMVSEDNRKGEQSVSSTPSVVPMVSEENREEEDVETYTPFNDSGLEINTNLDIIETDDDDQEILEESQPKVFSKKLNQKDKAKRTYKKPDRPCFVCGKNQTRLKRHILSKHSQHPSVAPILSMAEGDQNHFISEFRKEGIRKFNMDVIEKGGNSFMRERQSKKNEDIPVMCSGCKGFFAKSYKARHQLVCTASGSNLMMPLVNVAQTQKLDDYSDEFKELLNTLHLDNVGHLIKTDQIILMIGSRSYAALKRKKDKVTETKKSVRARMRLVARLYLKFLDLYRAQTAVTLDNSEDNAADMYRRETVYILANAINQLCDKPDEDNDFDGNAESITNQKSGLKISIFNTLKLSGKFLIGHYLILNEDDKSKKIVQFLEILKMLQEDLFGDAYYDLNYRKNAVSRKPQNLPKEDDVRLLNEECKKIMNSIDQFDLPSETFINVRSATATYLIIFNARRGGEPVRLKIHQWKQALDGYWADKIDAGDDPEMLVTFQTGKGVNNFVSVMFPPETFCAMKFLCKEDIRKEAGIPSNNTFIFANTQNSGSHTNGWHCINEMLKRLSLQGAINATRNRHRVASLLASLQLSETEKSLIFKHFGHSAAVNENVYQSANGTTQIQTTGQKLTLLNKSTGESSSTCNSKKSTNSVDVVSILSTNAATPSKTVVSTSQQQQGSSKSIPIDSNVGFKVFTSSKKTNDGKRNNLKRKSSQKYPKRKRISYDLAENIQKAEIESSEEDEDDRDPDFIAPLDENSTDISEEEVCLKSDPLRCTESKGNEKKRNYFTWPEEAKSAFASKFGEFLSKDFGYPGRSEMEAFAKKYGCTYGNVRTRIVNCRRDRLQRKTKLMKSMAMK